MESIVLIGAGGHCISCIDVLRLYGKYEIAGILDLPEKVGNIVSGIKVIGTDKDIQFMSGKHKNFLITIGQIKSAETRIRIFESVWKNGGKFPVIISPNAYVSKSAKIGEGSIIMHNAIINARAVIGKCCIINTGSLIEHEVVINDFCHVSTHAVVNGQVTVGGRSFIGSNSVIANNVTLPENIVVGAGACIFKSPHDSGVFLGNPARKI